MPNYQNLARRAAQKYGINPEIFLRQIRQESGFNPNARSSAGALGIAQFMPATARGMGIDPMNPRQALFAAAKMDAGHLKQYGGDWRKTLAAYNAGPGAVASGAWKSYGETVAYVSKILGGKTPFEIPRQHGGIDPVAGKVVQSNMLETVFARNQQFQTQGRIDPILATSVAQNGLTNMDAQKLGLQSLGPGGAVAGSPKQFGAIFKAAKGAIGTPYVWGGESYGEGGFDCSGLIQFAYAKAGIHIPRVAADQANVGKKVAWGQFRPGDLVFSDFTGSNKVTHVALYIGNGKVIVAPKTGDVVKIQDVGVFRKYFMGARRILH